MPEYELHATLSYKNGHNDYEGVASGQENYNVNDSDSNNDTDSGSSNDNDY